MRNTLRSGLTSSATFNLALRAPPYDEEARDGSLTRHQRPLDLHLSHHGDRVYFHGAKPRHILNPMTMPVTPITQAIGCTKPSTLKASMALSAQALRAYKRFSYCAGGQFVNRFPAYCQLLTSCS